MKKLLLTLLCCTTLNADEFSKYPAKVYNGKQTIPKDYKCDSAECRDINNKLVDLHINFAGKYSIIAHSCGSGCRFYSMVDMQNGKDDLEILSRFNTTPDISDKNSIDDLISQKDSNMLIAQYQYDNGECEQEKFVFGNKKLQSITKILESCNTAEATKDNESALYDEWVKQWGNHKWDNKSSNPAATNKAYSFDSAYIIVDMIKADDIAGLELIYKALEKDKMPNMALLNGIIGAPTFEQQAIDSANTKALDFLLKNHIVIDEVNDDGETKNMSDYANEKLNEAKSSGDSNAVRNYEKIIELLEQYKGGQ